MAKSYDSFIGVFCGRKSTLRFFAALSLSLVFCIARTAPALAEDPPEEVKAAYNSISGPAILDFIRLIASDKFKGRATGSEQSYQTALTIATAMKDAGFTPFGGKDTFLQQYPAENFKISSPYAFEIIKDGSVIATPVLGDEFAFRGDTGAGDVTAQAVFCGYGISIDGYDDYAGVDVAGKVAVVLNGLPPVAEKPENGDLKFAGYKVKNAKEHGAAAVVFIGDLESDSRPPAVSVFRGPFPYQPDIPVAKVGMKVANIISSGTSEPLASIKSVIDADGKPMSFALNTSVHIAVTVAYTPDAAAYNVVGLLPGRSQKLRDHYILVTAHMDHVGEQAGVVYNGADDNGSGTAVVHALVGALGKLTEHPKRSIVLVCFSGEEMGLLGSKYFVQNPPVPLKNIDAVINMDMVGMGSFATVFLGTKEPEIYGAFAANADIAGIKVTSDDANPGSDQASFVQADVPAVMVLTVGDHPFYHTPADDPETLNQGLLEDVAQLVLLAVWDLAEG